jgi:hypothetical protein
MGWEEYLITLYLRVCKEYKENLYFSCQRFTNGGYKTFTDEEVMVVYLVGILRGFKNIKTLHCYAADHLKSWFPGLPQYAAFVHRVNRLHEAFRQLIANLQAVQVKESDDDVYLMDSFPIMLAQHNHAYTAKVAPEIAGRGYCSTKKLHYYGVKAHVVARKRAGKLPDLEILMVEDASRHDGPIFDQMRPMLHDNLGFGDQAYKRPDAELIEKNQDLKILTPVKRARGQEKLNPEQRDFSKAVSRIRQPIEALFSWINKITFIQNAGLVRSTPGLLSHIFGKFAAAMLLRTYPLSDF